jgi:M-phase phosphoprotein-6
MNPEIERIMELEQTANDQKKKVNEKDVSDLEMANRYNTLVGTVSRKFSTKRTHIDLQEYDSPQGKKKMKFLKPSSD